MDVDALGVCITFVSETMLFRSGALALDQRSVKS